MRQLLALLVGIFLASAAQAQQVSNPISGPPTSVMNELTSWNSLYGNAIKHGPAFITNDMTSIGIGGSPLTARNTTALTAQDILTYTFLASGCTAPCTATSYDALRGIALAPASTSVNLVSGVSAYVVSDAPTILFGGFPAAVGLFAAGVSRANNAKVWGVNTLLTDTTTGVVSTGTGKELNNEFDFNVTSPNTRILGLQLAGGSQAQPAAAFGVVLQGLDVNVGSHVGAVAKWSAFLQANPGSTNIFAGLSPKDSVGFSIKSQDIILGFYGAGGSGATGTYGNTVLSASEVGGLEVFSATNTARAVTLTGGTGGSFRVPDQGGFIINSRVVMYGDGALFGVGSDVNYTAQRYGNSGSATSIYGAAISLITLPTLAGVGGLYVCVDVAGVLYRKAACP